MRYNTILNVQPFFTLALTIGISALTMLASQAQNARRPAWFIPSSQKTVNNTISVQPMSGGITPENLVANLLGPGISFSNVDYTGVLSAGGIFTNGFSAGLGFDQGIMLSSGSCASAVGPNNSISMSVDNDEPGDNDLDDISGYETFDASVLEFDFIPVTNSISFYFIFGSEEYPEFVGSQFNDVFAFF
jgi:hypothetical protein